MIKTYTIVVAKQLLKWLLVLTIKISLGQTINYTESAAVIANPERGLHKYSITGNNYATTTGANNFSFSTLNNWKNSADKVTVVYRCFLLDNFFNSNINATYLNNIQGDFNTARAAGIKVIVRFSYSNSQGSTPQQPTKAQILAHIAQLAPILQANKDVIFSFQAGFIGTWGEWYYTNYTEFGTESSISNAQWNNRKDILNTMLAVAPTEIPIQVRYPKIKTQLYGAVQLTAETAYKNTPTARIGFFNDAFLNNYGDQGTYAVSAECSNPVGGADYNYVSNETNYLPMTGETNGLNPCNNGFRTTGANAIYEMGLTNWTTLNRDYYTPFWNQIIASGTYNEILKKIGYRFVLNASTVTLHGATIDLSLDISNKGFARVFKQRNVYLVLKNTANNKVTTHVINTDIRTWEGSVLINQKIDVTEKGTYKLYIWMPDSEPSLRTNPDYSIQFANTGTWQSITGYNNLLQTITIETFGVENADLDNNFSIYPNPSTDSITVQFKDLDKAKIQICNMQGQLVYEKVIFNNQKINVSKLLKGVYFIRFSNNKHQAIKFIKK